jgi:uracil-DNA glycosylase
MAADYLPSTQTVGSLRKAAKKCHGCHLYKYATQTVFGEGPDDAELIIIGEIPGNKEDQLGKPFVGPAGLLLRESLESSGLNVRKTYFTNVVKHFKFTYMNKKKLHRTPVSAEIKACMPWLEAEIKVIQPKAILCLGATAAKSIVDKNFHIRDQRGKWFKSLEKISILVTFHPSAILRTPNREDRHAMKKIFIKDLQKVAMYLRKKI